MAQRERSSREWRGPEVVGVILVIAGAYWLLANAGLFFWLRWDFIWPLALIALGVVLVASRTGAGSGSRSAIVPREGATQVELHVGVGGGRFRLEGGASELVEVESTLGDVRSEVRRKGTAAFVRLRQERFPRAYWWGGTDWRIRIASDLPVDLRVTAGAGEFELDLASIPVVRASLSIGAANARVTLPRPGGTVEVRISTGAASLALLVPPGVEARVAKAGGLISIDGPTETPGYGTATDRVSVLVTGGASSITIR